MRVFLITLISISLSTIFLVLIMGFFIVKRKDKNINNSETKNSNEQGQSTNAERTKVIKQKSILKIFLKIFATLMFIFGFSITSDFPKYTYGLTWTELGAIAEGNIIDNTDAMFEFLGIKNLNDLEKIKDMEDQAKNALNDSLILICIYWATCSALFFVHIKTKKIIIKGEISNEKD